MLQGKFELLAFLIGAALGIFYAFDGWRGSFEETDLKDSPRVKNFIWVIVGAFALFIGDLKAIDPSIEKQQVLLVYVIGFLTLAVVVVVAWGMAIFLKFLFLRLFDRQNYPSPPFTPVLDYFLHGARIQRQRYEKALESKHNLARRRFLHNYGKQVAATMAAVYVVSEDLTSKREVIVQVLRSIQGAVREHNAHVDGLEVNCNYMRAYPKTALPELKGRLKFTFGSLDRYPWFLALEEYADDKGREDFVLPVEERREHKSDRKSLPGAPLAFLLNETIVIDDLDHFKYPRNLPKTVVEELRAYFEGKSFKSFGSLNIRVSGKRLGIVNVEANKPFVFGRTEEEKTEITALLHPFCQLLGQMILKL